MNFLPREPLWQIFNALPRKDLIQLSLTQKYFYAVINSIDFLRYRLSCAGFFPQPLLETKPKQASYFEWFYLAQSRYFERDPIRRRLGLTPEDAYDRVKAVYKSRLRSKVVLLIEAIKRRRKERFLQLLPEIKQKDIKGRARSDYFFDLDREIFLVAVFSDDPFYLIEIFKYKKLVNAFRWSNIFSKWEYFYLIKRDIYQLIVPYLKEHQKRLLHILEDSKSLQIIETILEGGNVTIDNDINIIAIMTNLEVRDLAKANHFYQKVILPRLQMNGGQNRLSRNLPHIGIKTTRIIEYAARLGRNTTLALPCLGDVKMVDPSRPLSWTNLNGVYYMIYREIPLPLEVIQKIVEILLDRDDAWDAIIYFLLTYRDKIELTLAKYPHLSSNKQQLLKDVLDGKKIDFFAYFK